MMVAFNILFGHNLMIKGQLKLVDIFLYPSCLVYCSIESDIYLLYLTQNYYHQNVMVKTYGVFHKRQLFG